MGRLSKQIANSQQARLWQRSGEGDFCARIARICNELGAEFNRKQLLGPLGIKAVSLYSLLRGQCTYNLFVQQIAPAELARLHRKSQGQLNPDDSILTDEQWERLDIVGLIRIYAPSLLSRIPAVAEMAPDLNTITGRNGQSKVTNDIFEVSHELLEEVTPLLLHACKQLLDCRHHFSKKEGNEKKSTNLENSNESSELLQYVVDSMPFPAGFVFSTHTPKVLECNELLGQLFGVNRSEIAGHELGKLIALAVRNSPLHLQGSLNDLLYRRMGARVAQSREKDPLCMQFYLDNRGRGPQEKYTGCYRVTVVVFNLAILGNFAPADTFFAYHLKSAFATP